MHSKQCLVARRFGPCAPECYYNYYCTGRALQGDNTSLGVCKRLGAERQRGCVRRKASGFLVVVVVLTKKLRLLSALLCCGLQGEERLEVGKWGRQQQQESYFWKVKKELWTDTSTSYSNFFIFEHRQTSKAVPV